MIWGKQNTPLKLAVVVLMACGLAGCSTEDAKEAVKKAEDSVSGAANEMAKGASEAVEEGQKMASELGEQAMGFLSPLKDQFSGLEKLVENPAELKTAVNGLLESLEKKTESIQLPESIETALNTAKQKLTELGEYLAGEYDQAQLGEKVKEITDSVKSALGMGS